MGILKQGNRRVYYDMAIPVPYDKTGEGEVTFYFKWVSVMKRTETAPEEGGYLETVHIEGFHYDDDLPDLEMDALMRADELVIERGLLI